MKKKTFNCYVDKVFHRVILLATEDNFKHLAVEMVDDETGETIALVSLSHTKVNVYAKVENPFDLFVNVGFHPWLSDFLIKNEIAVYTGKFGFVRDKLIPLFRFDKNKLTYL